MAGPPLKTVAMVGWSGAGDFEDLRRTAAHKLRPEGDTERLGDVLLVDSEDPVAVARNLSQMPGVAWIAVGQRFKGEEGYLKTLLSLARRYVKGKPFRISAKVSGSDRSAGDIVLMGNSELLSAIPATKVDEKNALVRFRVSLAGEKGACGVEIRAGPGGMPTRDEWAACLVSGGERSSAMAWMAALSGYSLRLVHSQGDEASLVSVARLYSELSFRMDPRCLELVVLDGGEGVFARLGGWLRDNGEAALAGGRPPRLRDAVDLAAEFPGLLLPLVLVQDEEVASVYRSLNLGRSKTKAAAQTLTVDALKTRGPYRETRFGGVQADLNRVVDAVRLESARGKAPARRGRQR